MTVPTTIDAGAWIGNYLTGEDADGDLARAMLKAFSEAVMSAQASAQCGAAYGERTEDRENTRNGYRSRPWDTRVGTIELKVPKLRSGVYSPEFLLSPRRRAEQALVAVICQAYVEGVSTRCRRRSNSPPGGNSAAVIPQSLAGVIPHLRAGTSDSPPGPLSR